MAIHNFSWIHFLANGRNFLPQRFYEPFLELNQAYNFFRFTFSRSFPFRFLFYAVNRAKIEGNYTKAKKCCVHSLCILIVARKKDGTNDNSCIAAFQPMDVSFISIFNRKFQKWTQKCWDCSKSESTQFVIRKTEEKCTREQAAIVKTKHDHQIKMTKASSIMCQITPYTRGINTHSMKCSTWARMMFAASHTKFSIYLC